MNHHTMNLNIRHDLPDRIWQETVPRIYGKMEGWIGFEFKSGLPCWFGYSEDEKHIYASVEPSGLLFEALMDDAEWESWKLKIKKIATQELGFKVGEFELGEV